RRIRPAPPATGAGTAQRWARSRVPARAAPPSGRKAAVRTQDVLDGLSVRAAAAPPSGRKAAIPTASARALSQGRGGPTGLPVATSQRCSVWPRVAVSAVLPSGLKATRRTGSRWARGGWAGLPVAVSHSRAVPSLLPVRIVLPSALTATA